MLSEEYQSPFSRVPTLLQLCIRSIIATNLSTQMSDSFFIKKNQMKKDIIMKWEYEKLSQQLPKLLKIDSVTANSELKKIVQLRLLIKSVRYTKCEGYNALTFYGGYIRDHLCSSNMIIPHDIDIMFSSEEKMNEYIDELLDIHKVEFCENYHPVRIPRHSNLCQHSQKVAFCESKYENSDVKTITVTDIKTGASIQIDLALSNQSAKIRDFDVNSLELKIYNNYITSGLVDVEKETILEHIAKKVFVVLTNTGGYKLKHDYQSFSINKFGVQYTDYSCRFECICRNSSKGMKIKERIVKMQTRGWKVLNPPCRNPFCILSPDDLYEQYAKETLIAKGLIKRRKEVLVRKKLERREIIRLEKQTEFLSEKDISTKKYEKHSSIKPPRSPYQSDFRNYRKDGINKKIVRYDEEEM